MSIMDQGINFFRFFLSFLLVYVIWPVLLFKVTGEDWIERFLARFSRMVLLVIILGYFLVVVKLYELLSLFWVLVTLTVLLNLPAEKRWQMLKKSISNFYLWLFDVLDGRVNPLKIAGTRLRERFGRLLEMGSKLVPGKRQAFEIVLIGAVFITSGVVRFIEPFQHAAPAMSDSYVTLAWMKYIEHRILFQDGIYPQGFHIYLSVLHKFAGNDALYTLKYAGPLSGFLMVLGVYLFVSRLTGRALPGMTAAFMIGVMGQFLPLGWERQAATNSQEFALAFLLPAWHFAYRFLDTGKREHLWSAAVAFSIIGLVHSLVFAFLCVGLVFLFFAHLLIRMLAGVAGLWKLLFAVSLAGIIAALPIPLGFLLGKTFNKSSADFLMAKLQTNIPPVTFFDWMGIAGFILFLIYNVGWNRRKTELVKTLFAVFLGVASLLMYLLLGQITSNAVFVTRMGLLWSLMAAVGCGLFCWVILKLLPHRMIQLEPIVYLGFIISTVLYFQPGISQPYRMQYDSTVNQYLRISNQYTNTSWLMVSETEGYDLSLGHGWHYQLRDFLKDFDPAREILARLTNGQQEVLQNEDIFIFAEKKVYPVNIAEMKEELVQRSKDYTGLENWVRAYLANHQDMTVYYDDPDITVYHIHHPKTDKEKQREIWGS